MKKVQDQIVVTKNGEDRLGVNDFNYKYRIF